MTYVTWPRQDDVTYAKMCLPSLETDTMRRFPPLESSKSYRGKTPGGWYPPPLGVRGLSYKWRAILWLRRFVIQKYVYIKKTTKNVIISDPWVHRPTRGQLWYSQLWVLLMFVWSIEFHSNPSRDRPFLSPNQKAWRTPADTRDIWHAYGYKYIYKMYSVAVVVVVVEFTLLT